MAFDVTLTLLIHIFCVIFTVLVNSDESVHLITKPLNIEDNLYFELVEPEEISYTYKIRPAKGFGGTLNVSFYGIGLIMANPIHACSPISNTAFIRNQIALIERGGCSFVSKSLHAEEAGALAAVIMDNDHTNDERMVDMVGDDTDREVALPAFFMLGRDGYMIKKTLEEYQLAGALINIPINATGIPLNQLNQPPWTLW